MRIRGAAAVAGSPATLVLDPRAGAESVSVVSAAAITGTDAMAAPTPSAIANAPIRPT